MADDFRSHRTIFLRSEPKGGRSTRPACISYVCRCLRQKSSTSSSTPKHVSFSRIRAAVNRGSNRYSAGPRRRRYCPGDRFTTSYLYSEVYAASHIYTYNQCVGVCTCTCFFLIFVYLKLSLFSHTKKINNITTSSQTATVLRVQYTLLH